MGSGAEPFPMENRPYFQGSGNDDYRCAYWCDGKNYPYPHMVEYDV